MGKNSENLRKLRASSRPISENAELAITQNKVFYSLKGCLSNYLPVQGQ